MKKKKNLVDWLWILKISFLAFTISIVFSTISEVAIPSVNLFSGILITLIFLLLGIIFDMIGISVTASDEAKFNSMASQKIRGAKMAVRMKKNAEKVSSFCNDVVGDICGIISGATGAVISLKIISITGVNSLFITVLVMGIISTLTIGGKALVKGYAIKNSNNILFNFSKVLSIFVRSR